MKLRKLTILLFTLMGTMMSAQNVKMVDLGLSVYWADCNVGAASPEQPGNYYAWGETQPKATYEDDNCTTLGRSLSNIGGNASFDAARANLGGTWRLPTTEEFQELKDKCSWAWTRQNGQAGFLVTGPNGNAIFLPACGSRTGSDTDDMGSYGLYWTSSVKDNDNENAQFFLFEADFSAILSQFRSIGRSVRAVSSKGFGQNTGVATTTPVTPAVATTPTTTPAVTSTPATTPAVTTTTTEPSSSKDSGISMGFSNNNGLSSSNGQSSSKYEQPETVVPQVVAGSYVDLGLSCLWADRNIGANSAEESGEYFAWGETSTKETYDQENNTTFGQTIETFSGNPAYDAATAKWGDGWRMPTEDECIELIDKCQWEWTTYNGIQGMRVTGPNGNSIFLPASGWRKSDYIRDFGTGGDYWSASPFIEDERDNPFYATDFLFNAREHDISASNRRGGRTIRPVRNR